MLFLVKAAMFGSLVADAAQPRKAEEEQAPMTITIAGGAFENGKPIPEKYTGHGEDVSPPLSWTNVPPTAKSLALICDDPDAPVGTWVHWVLYGIPANVTELTANQPAAEILPNGARQGRNDFKRIGYRGPCPPKGKRHRYFFKLYALDTSLDLRAGASKTELVGAMKGHVIAEGQLMGTYETRD